MNDLSKEKSYKYVHPSTTGKVKQIYQWNESVGKPKDQGDDFVA